MTRGRRPKPTHLKLLTGNPGKRPIQPDPVQPVTPPAPLEPPTSLLPDARAEWQRLAPSLTQLGLLTDLDWASFAAYCQAFGRWAQAEALLAILAEQDPTGRSAMLVRTRAGGVTPNPLIWVARNAANDLVRLGAEFGLTPSARSRLALHAPGSSARTYVPPGPYDFFDD
jgi:P27 family predicted phage terminase small subunit